MLRLQVTWMTGLVLSTNSFACNSDGWQNEYLNKGELCQKQHQLLQSPSTSLTVGGAKMGLLWKHSDFHPLTYI